MTYYNTTIFNVEIGVHNSLLPRTVSLPFGRDMHLNKQLYKYKVISLLGNGTVVEHLLISFYKLDLNTLRTDKWGDGSWERIYVHVISVKYYHINQQFHTALFPDTINYLLHELKGTIQPVMSLQEFIYRRAKLFRIQFNGETDYLKRLQEIPYLSTISKLASIGADNIVTTVMELMEAGIDAMCEYIDQVTDGEMMPPTLESLLNVYDMKLVNADPITSHLIREDRPVHTANLANWVCPTYQAAALRSQVDYSTPFGWSRDIIFCVPDNIRFPIANILDFLFDDMATDISLEIKQPDKITVHYAHSRYTTRRANHWTTVGDGSIAYSEYRYSCVKQQLALVCQFYGATSANLIKTWLEEVFIILHCPDGEKHMFFDLTVHQLCSHSLINRLLVNID